MNHCKSLAILIGLALCWSVPAFANPWLIDRSMEPLDPIGQSSRPSWDSMHDTTGADFIDFGEGLAGQDFRQHQGPVLNPTDGCEDHEDCTLEGFPDPNDCDGDNPPYIPIGYPTHWSHAHGGDGPGANPDVPIEPRREDPQSLEPGEPFADSGVAVGPKAGDHVIHATAYGDRCGGARNGALGGVIRGGTADGVRFLVGGFVKSSPNNPGVMRLRTFDAAGLITCQELLDPTVFQPYETVEFAGCEAAAFTIDAIMDYQAMELREFHTLRELTPALALDTDDDSGLGAGNGGPNTCDCDFDQSGVCGATDNAEFGWCFNNDPNVETFRCAETDMNSDGVMNLTDSGLFGAAYAKVTPCRDGW